MQHAWKQDVCANCSQPHSSHTGPVPARRVVKTYGEGNQALEAKPSIANKPTYIRPTYDTQHNMSDDYLPGDVIVNFSPSNSPKPQKAAKPKISTSGHRSKHIEPVRGEESDEEEEVYRAPGQHNSSHYYHKYDMTGKGRSGSPRPAKKSATDPAVVEITHKHVAVENFMLNQGAKKFVVAPQRVMELVSGEVAMPYNIVDVSTIPTNMDPKLLERPPNVPAVAPEEEEHSSGVGSLSSTLSSTHSSVPGSTSPQSSPLLAHRQSPIAHRNSPSPGPKHSPSPTPKHRQSPALARRVQTIEQLYDLHAYEVIDGEDMTSGRYSRKTDLETVPLSRNDGSRASQRSADLEAKMAALSNIDFKNVAQPPVTESNDSNQCSKKKNAVVIAPNKEEEKVEEKGKKTGGRSFFKKLFSFGSKDSKESDTENMSEIEPVKKEEDPVTREDVPPTEPVTKKVSRIAGQSDTGKEIAEEMKAALKKKANRSESLRSQPIQVITRSGDEIYPELNKFDIKQQVRRDDDKPVTMPRLSSLPVNDKPLTMGRVSSVPANEKQVTMTKVSSGLANEKQATMPKVSSGATNDKPVTMPRVSSLPASDKQVTMPRMSNVPANDKQEEHTSPVLLPKPKQAPKPQVAPKNIKDPTDNKSKEKKVSAENRTEKVTHRAPSMREGGSKMLKRPPSVPPVPPPAVPGSRRDSSVEDGHYTPPASPRSPGIGSPPLSPKPDTPSQVYGTSKLDISAPRLQRTSVNLENTVTTNLESLIWSGNSGDVADNDNYGDGHIATSARSTLNRSSQRKSGTTYIHILP